MRNFLIRLLGGVPADSMTADSNFNKVINFMRAVGQEVLRTPGFPSPAIVDLRVKLIEEELDELREGIANGDIVEVADAITDLLYVVYGTAAAMGIDADACFQEVHSSNMTKVGPNGEVLRNEQGKIMKPATYVPPDLDTVIREQFPLV